MDETLIEEVGEQDLIDRTGADTIESITTGNKTKSGRIIKISNWFKDYAMMTFQEIVSGPDSEKWMEAVEDEKNSLIENKTFEEIDVKNIPNGASIISSKWVFKVKDDIRYKARLATRGFEQNNLDYQETFSPIMNISVLRAILALSANRSFFYAFFDVKTAFLHGDLSENIYMKLPQGFDEKKFCKLKKIHLWFKTSANQLEQKIHKFFKKERTDTD